MNNFNKTAMLIYTDVKLAFYSICVLSDKLINGFTST